MRLSSDPADPDYRPDLFSTAKIRFNGYEVTRVVLADEERGYIVQISTDYNGNMLVRHGEMVTEKRFGGVQIILADEQPVLDLTGMLAGA